MSFQGWDPGLRRELWIRRGINYRIGKVQKQQRILGNKIRRDQQGLYRRGILRKSKARLGFSRNQGMNFVLIKTESCSHNRQIRKESVDADVVDILLEGNEEFIAGDEEFQNLTDGEMEELDTLQVDNDGVMEPGAQNIAGGEEEKKKGTRKALFKPTSLAVGTSKKLFVQAVLSPRKKVQGKVGKKQGKVTRKKEDKGPSNPIFFMILYPVESSEVMSCVLLVFCNFFPLVISSVSVFLLLVLRLFRHSVGLLLLACYNRELRLRNKMVVLGLIVIGIMVSGQSALCGMMGLQWNLVQVCKRWVLWTKLASSKQGQRYVICFSQMKFYIGLGGEKNNFGKSERKISVLWCLEVLLSLYKRKMESLVADVRLVTMDTMEIKQLYQNVVFIFSAGNKEAVCVCWRFFISSLDMSSVQGWNWIILIWLRLLGSRIRDKGRSLPPQVLARWSLLYNIFYESTQLELSWHGK
ncbi:uncharacterized protein LOC130506059 isoform X1 [Raphanus sativus]|uniref:Uncharacterized protein LOC130498376 isoform X1 n=2 Tax=Raphanus sativus TaxID=3726 RepID=A0A9W3CYR6_RAPSA|nr:uncharacterized protein LOC130498376 isoform X1 [Raphanus sativus]XP_056856649.1 uncharacterized protein LOC130506059 isoform X1 [Raphanus sativus]